MPYSTTRFDSYIWERLWRRKGCRILDVWPWAGKYGNVMRDYYEYIDGVEIHEPYVHQFALKNLYRHIHIANIVDFRWVKGEYDIVIMWDILEHLSIEDAKKVIEYCKQQNVELYVQVPYEMEQWAYEGNIYETHLQADLTEAIMQERYPELQKLVSDGVIWLYYANFTQHPWDFKQDMVDVFARIDAGHKFALARYGDGERMLIDGQAVGMGSQAQVADKWTAPNGSTLLWQDLKATMDIYGSQFIYAIPCKCCNDNCKQRYLELLDNRWLSYANIFINGNRPAFIEKIKQYENVVVIGNHEGMQRRQDSPLGIKASDYYSIPDDCVNRYRDNKWLLLDWLRKYTDTKDMIFLVSAWPLANIIVHFLWKLNKNNVYLDVWSAIDQNIHWRVTRPYMQAGSIYHGKMCIF